MTYYIKVAANEQRASKVTEQVGAEFVAEVVVKISVFWDITRVVR
jgi:hypothetical protein